jgi:hypothetical protein
MNVVGGRAAHVAGLKSGYRLLHRLSAHGQCRVPYCWHKYPAIRGS